jgi:2'-5' RNA ligase
VKSQGGLGADLAWLPRVRAVTDGFAPFAVTFGEARRFGESVVYLSVESPSLMELHARLVDAVRPSPTELAAYHEGDGFIPHLTLAQGAGLDVEQLLQRAGSLGDLGTWTCAALDVFRLQPPATAYARFETMRLAGS